MATVTRSSRYFEITPADTTNFLDIGPAATQHNVGVMELQFNPSFDWNGTLALLGRTLGQTGAPLVSVPYRRVSLNGLASDYAMVSDVITGSAVIQVPCNGLALALLVSCSTGSCEVFGWDMNGPSAV